MQSAIETKLREALYVEVHESSVPAKEIATRMEVSYNHLARSVMPGKSGVNFPVHWLPRLMLTTGSHRPLKLLANGFGFLLASRPQQPVQPVELFGLMGRFARCMNALSAWAKVPEQPELAESAIREITQIQEETEFWKLRIMESQRPFPQAGLRAQSVNRK